MLCFAVFLGSWSPLSTTGISLPSLSNPASKGAVDYSTPSGEEQFKEREFDNTGFIAVPCDKKNCCTAHTSAKNAAAHADVFLGGMRSM